MGQKKKTVLVVDDVADLRHLVMHYLTDAGFEIREAQDAFTALRSLEADGAVDIILSDFQMPEMNGISLFHAVRKTGRATPFVLMSGNLQFAKRQLIDLGIADFIGKPFSSDELIECLSRALKTITATPAKALPEIER